MFGEKIICIIPQKLQKFSPLHLFVSISGGCGKSDLIKTINDSMTKLFLYHGGNTNIRVLLLAKTDVAAIHIDGTTIHSLV